MDNRRHIKMEELRDIELTPEQAARANEAIAASDKEESECRVNFRWQKEPLSVVRKVAEIMGIPYQNYIKQVLYKQAILDLREFAVHRLETGQDLPSAAPFGLQPTLVVGTGGPTATIGGAIAYRPDTSAMFASQHGPSVASALTGPIPVQLPLAIERSHAIAKLQEFLDSGTITTSDLSAFLQDKNKSNRKK